jgi:DNA replication and repair protein RecF
MKSEITSLHLQQFRSYDDFAVELSPNVNIIVGPNASGKTNLLEAVLLVTGSSSFRASVADVIQHTKQWARVEAMMTDISRSVSIERSGDTCKRRYVINEVQRQRLRFEDSLPVVLFEPENMRLLTGSPDLRRDFLDDILSITDPQFASTKKHYIRALVQRNNLLKQHKNNIQDQVFVWNIRLSELAGYIAQARHGLITLFNTAISETYSTIATKKHIVQLHYISPLQIDNYESQLLQMLEKHLPQDIERGFTAYGPHREDFTVELRNVAAKVSASRGETRTLVLSLKLLEVSLLNDTRNTKPLVLLDDVFSELDGARRKALTTYLTNHQTIITTTDADVVAKDFAQHANTISL